MTLARVRKGDTVVVVSGRDKGRRGEILRVIPKKAQVIVKGLNRVKRHQKPTQQNPKGSVIEKEVPMHVSNVMPWDGKESKGTRVSRKVEKGRRVRVAKASGKEIEIA